MIRLISITVLFFILSCTSSKTVKLFDEHSNLPKKIIDLEYGYSFSVYLNSKIVDNPSRNVLKSIKYNKLQFKKKHFRHLITNDVNVYILFEVIKTRDASVTKEVNKISQLIKVRDSIELFTYTLNENSMSCDIIEYHKKLEAASLKITFLTFSDGDKIDKYTYLEEFALPIIKSVESNIYEKESKEIEKNIYGYMFDMYEQHGNFFQAIYFLGQLNDTIKRSLISENAMYNSFVGNYSSFLERGKEKPPSLSNVSYINAVDHIIEIADDYDFILFNEDHQDPYCRYFVKEILPKLKTKGYTNLGIETLSYIKHDVNKYGFPIHGSGFFTDEPQMANLVRDAVSIGFNVFPYEAYSFNCGTCKNRLEKQQFRESGQAENIINFTASENKGKTIILAGHQHIYTSNDNPTIKLMAEVLKLKTNKRVLSINQTSQELYSIPNQKNDCIPVDSIGNYYLSPELKGKVDLQLIHNGIHYYTNQNDFNQIIGQNTFIEVPVKSDATGYLIVYSVDENNLFPMKKIPLSVVAFEARTKKVHFKLNEGDYIALEFDVYGMPINITKIKV